MILGNSSVVVSEAILKKKLESLILEKIEKENTDVTLSETSFTNIMGYLFPLSERRYELTNFEQLIVDSVMELYPDYSIIFADIEFGYLIEDVKSRVLEIFNLSIYDFLKTY